jgi:hypothetical protein
MMWGHLKLILSELGGYEVPYLYAVILLKWRWHVCWFRLFINTV